MSALFALLSSTVVPLLGPLLTAALLLYGAYTRWVEVPHKWVMDRRTLVVLCVVALLCDAWLGTRMVLSQRAHQQRQDGAAVRASRERFVLPRDFQYGELLIPAGSVINRRDPFDKGEARRPLALHGLEAVRFSQPVQVAGVWAQALQVLPMRVELAQDQRIGPLHRYDTTMQQWNVNPVVPALACKQGQIALFQVPHIAYDVQAEMDRPPPDGAEARFAPSQWLFRQCENGPPVEVQPASQGTAPVWSDAP